MGREEGVNDTASACEWSPNRASETVRRYRLQSKVDYRLLDPFPRRGVRIDYIQVPGAVKFKQAGVLFLFSGSPLFISNIVPAESNRNCVIGVTVNQPLARMEKGKLQGIRFAVVIGDLTRRAAEKLDHGVIAEVQLIGPLQVNDSSK